MSNKEIWNKWWDGKDMSNEELSKLASQVEATIPFFEDTDHLFGDEALVTIRALRDSVFRAIHLNNLRAVNEEKKVSSE